MNLSNNKLTTVLLLLCLSSITIANNEAYKHTGVFYDSSCGLNSKAAQLATLIINHIKQQRKNLVCHPILAVTAAKKAKSMASNQRVEHNLDLQAPNALLESNGYLLPAVFLPTSNQVESIAAGRKTALETLQGLLNSHGHRSHILGLSEFNAQQIHIGVGYFYNPDTPHEYHWAVHIAQPRESINNKQTVDYSNSVTNNQSKPN